MEGKKCGIVTTDTYNDWLVIGYTPVQLFFPEQQNFTLLKLETMSRLSLKISMK